MTAEESITKFQNMIDDVVDSDFAYQLLNDAKDEVEAMAEWEILKKEQTYSVSSGYSYTSALGALPTRFANDVRVTEDDSYFDLEKVAFDDRSQKVHNSQAYFIDLANNNLHLAGENHSAKTLYFYYTEYSADLTSTDSWVFPSRFHSILPLKMAELYYMADSGERNRSWDDKWAIQFERQLGRMQAWNDRLKTRNRRSFRRTPTQTPKNVI